MILSLTNNNNNKSITYNKFDKQQHHHMKEEGHQKKKITTTVPTKPVEETPEADYLFSVVSDTVSERSTIISSDLTYSSSNDFDTLTYSSSDDDDDEVVELQLKDEEPSNTSSTGMKEEKKKQRSSTTTQAVGEYEVPEFNKENVKKVIANNNSTNNQTKYRTSSSKIKGHNNRRVTFDSIKIRRYPIILGDNPCVRMGPPISLGWEYDDGLPILDLEDYECIRKKTRRTKIRDLLMSYYQRRDVLLRCGYTHEEQQVVTKEISKIRWQRMTTTALLPVSKIEEIAQSAKRKVQRRMNNNNNNKKKTTSSISSSSSSVVIAATATSSNNNNNINNNNNDDDNGMWL